MVEATESMNGESAELLSSVETGGRLPPVPEIKIHNIAKDRQLQKFQKGTEGAWQWALRGGLCNKFGDPLDDASRLLASRDVEISPRLESGRSSPSTAIVSGKSSPVPQVQSSRPKRAVRRRKARNIHQKHRTAHQTKQIFLLPSKAAERRRRFRRAIRMEFAECDCPEALDEARDEINEAMTRKSEENSESALAQIVNEALWNFDPGVLHDIWRGAIQQVIDEELHTRHQEVIEESKLAQHDQDRYQELIELRMKTPKSLKSGGSETPRSGSETPKAAREDSRATLKPPREDGRLTLKHVHGSVSTLHSEDNNKLEVPRERAWKASFGRLSQGFRLRQADLPKALELCGVPYPDLDWADEIFNSIVKGSAMTSEEFVRIVRAYFERQRFEYNNTLRRFDEDNSGTISVGELQGVLRSYSMDLLPHVVDEVISEVDKDRSGCLNLDEFIEFMETLTQTDGFSKEERNALYQIHKRFDCNGTDSIPTENMPGVLAWLGYSIPEAEVLSIAAEVDVDACGSLDYQEFLMCMRKVRQKELKAIEEAIKDHDSDESGSLCFEELEPFLNSMGYMSTRVAITDAAAEANINLQEMKKHDLWKFMQVFRTREGLSSAESAEVDAAFQRYDLSESGEISAVDIGKILRWFGYRVSYMEQCEMVGAVDIDRSGRLNKTEFRKLMRFYWERELRKMEASFNDHCGERRLCSQLQAEKAFRQLGFVDSDNKTPVVLDAEVVADGIDKNGFVHVGIQFKLLQREMFRKSAGYNANEVAQLQQMFNEYDEDHSDSIGTNELGGLIRNVFPVMTKSIRSQVDSLMKEIDADGPGMGRLSFDDFLRTMRQFHDINAQERIEKMERCVAETEFSQIEVQGFNELFTASDTDMNGRLSEVEVREMIQNVCPLGTRNGAELHKMFVNVQETVEHHNSKGSHDLVDFPEFLLLMRKLLDVNFGNMQSTLAPKRESTAAVTEEAN